MTSNDEIVVHFDFLQMLNNFIKSAKYPGAYLEQKMTLWKFERSEKDERSESGRAKRVNAAGGSGAQPRKLSIFRVFPC